MAMFKSNELGLSPNDYFYKRIHELKNKLGNVPVPKQTRQSLISFCRRMEPPSRQQLIPLCTTGEVEKCSGTPLDSFPWTKPPGAKTSVEKKDISKPEVEAPPPKSTKKKLESNEDESKPIPAPSYRNESGVIITDIAGIGDDYDDDDDDDDDNAHGDVQIIPLMSLETSPEIKKLHPRYRLKRFGIYFVRLERVVDPLDFFMEFIQKPPEDGCKDWSECLQHFYGDPKVAAQYKMVTQFNKKTLLPLVGQRYAIYNDELEKWERVRIIGLSIRGGSAQVAFLDRLDPPLEINFGAFYELNVKFDQWAKYPLKGALKDVRPHNFVEGEDDNRARFDFSVEAIEYFKKATTKDKMFRAFIIQKTADKMDYFGYGDEDRFTTCMVYLFEVGKPMIPLNAEMVQKGFLKPIKSMVCAMQLIKNLHGLDLQVEHPQQTMMLNQMEDLHLEDVDVDLEEEGDQL